MPVEFGCFEGLPRSQVTNNDFQASSQRWSGGLARRVPRLPLDGHDVYLQYRAREAVRGLRSSLNHQPSSLPVAEKPLGLTRQAIPKPARWVYLVEAGPRGKSSFGKGEKIPREDGHVTAHPTTGLANLQK